MTESNGAQINAHANVKIVGFVLRFDNLSEMEVWTDAETATGGLNIARALVKDQKVGGIIVSTPVVKEVFRVLVEGEVRRAERRPTSAVPLLELREVAEAAAKLADENPEDAAYDELRAALTRLGSN